MSSKLVTCCSSLVCQLCLLGLAAADPIKPATDAPQPLTPEESLKRFQIAPGFHIELVASEPHLADPVAMDFDARGRIFVCEIHGYNLEGYLDIVELNKTGVLDTAVRRILANPEAIERAAKEQYGTVKLLEDTDGDGIIDRSHVWADHLLPCYGVVAAREGVIVLCAPDILYLADRDGDGRAEVKETLFTGFGVYEMWSRISNPRWGPDNWIYAANGISSGGTITGPHLPGPVQIPATTFRFKADGSALEPTSGSASGFGLAIDDWGDRFLVTNQQHALFVAPLAHRYLARNPYYAAPNLVENISSYGHPARVYPTSQPDPWRLARSKDPAWVKFYGAAEATANGYFTAASGQAIYQADAFPPEFHGNHFSVDNAQNLIHRCILERQDVGYRVRRPNADETTEFLTSTEQWFRPVNLTVGPDGALYVVDMYRSIIEDYSAIPRFLQQMYVESLIAGSDLGRIWRIVADGSRRPAKADLSAAATAELVGHLPDANIWWRQTAQRLLVERGDKAAVPAIVQLAANGPTPQGRLHALHTLDGLNGLTPDVVERALGDQHPAVRTHAMILAERWLQERPNLVQRICGMVGDSDSRVRLQVALTLGESDSSSAAEALARLAARYGEDAWLQAAILSSAADTAAQLAANLLGSTDVGSQGQTLLRPLGAIVGARHRNDEISRVLASVERLQGGDAAARQTACLAGLVEGLNRGKPEVLTAALGQQTLRGLLASSHSEVRQRAFEVAKLVRLQEAPEMKAALEAAGKTALDEERALPERLAAIALLKGAPLDEVQPVAEKLLAPRQPLDLQLAAIEAMSTASDARAASILVADWSSKSPKVQSAAIEAMFQRQNRLPLLLDALQRGEIPLSTLDAARREQLRNNPDAEIRRRATALLAGQAAPKDRQEVLARYTSALSLARDVGRGQTVFQRQCAKCHRVRDQGYVVGPDLAATVQRTDEMLVSDAFDPSNQITAGYNSYTIVTEDGRIFTGVLAAESATGVTLRREEGKEDTILRKDIDEMSASSVSLMPERVEQEITPQEFADLIAYLRQAFGPELPAKVTLFDDDPQFIGLLNQGEGRATVETADRLSGTLSLRMAPPQRWSLRIPGWEYRIVEHPAPGEYRYLRLAWKSCGGEGVMVELAGDGSWPPADKPMWRYYSGKNTTGWAARQVAAEAPQQWVEHTFDLWKDFGSFTLTGIAPTALGGDALFDRIELLRQSEGAAVGGR